MCVNLTKGCVRFRINLVLPMTQALSVISSVACAPAAHLPEDRLKAFAALGQRILHFWRNHFVHLSPNQTITFQFAKMLSQHLLARVAEQVPELPKPEYFICFYVIQQQRFVLSAHHRQRDLHRTKNRFLCFYGFQSNARLQKGA